MAEIRSSPRPGVQTYSKPKSVRLTSDEVVLLKQVMAALNTSSSEVFRFLLREHGPAYLPPEGDGADDAVESSS